ncbi:MAG: peptidylprolyl isomerase [Prevotella sp.]|jgi:peptidyl-prolyl cis-trans isomerase SurA|nr:peptidylprolyl isomerase [Prevotella sp.]
MNKKLFLILITFLATCAYAQQADPVAIKINGKPVYRSELEKAYKKSNELKQEGQKEPFSDFIKSYIDFKLNVEEAKAQHLDTTGSYIRDLSSARVELSRPYMQDTTYEDKYMRGVYSRMLEDVEINHVLLPYDNDVVLPADTLALYNKAVDLRNRLVKNGFAAEGYEKKPQTSVVIDSKGRNGYIGWTVPLMFPAKVEDAMYSLAINQISLPIRTAQGFHIVQVLGRRPAVGSAEIEQVMFNFTQVPPDRNQLDSVGSVAWREYRKIHSPEDFNLLCEEFSRVMQTGDEGCYGGMVNLESFLSPSFVNAALNLKEAGDVSEPVWSDYGYHIIRLLKKIPISDYDNVKGALRGRIGRAGRMPDMTKEKRFRMAAELKLVINDKAYSALNDIADGVSPKDSLFLERVKNDDDILFSFENGESRKVNDFIQYIRFRQDMLNAENKPKDAPAATILQDMNKYTLSTDILKEYFESFLSRSLTDYYYLTLADRFTKYKEQLDELSDGLLLFAVKNKNIWERSAIDEKGLSDYFNNNKTKYSLGGTKYRGLIVYAKNEDTLIKAEAMAQKQKNRDALIKEIREAFNKDSFGVLMVPGTWAKGANPYVDNKIYGGGDVTAMMGYPFFFVTGEFITSPQDYSDVKSAVEQDYQDILEKEWQTYLNKKYEVKTDKSVLKTIK